MEETRSWNDSQQELLAAAVDELGRAQISYAAVTLALQGLSNMQDDEPIVQRRGLQGLWMLMQTADEQLGRALNSLVELEMRHAA